MADNYHLIDSPEQTVVGSRIAELFEVKPASTYINDLAITTGGGRDTIKINDSSELGFDLVITDWNSDAKLDFTDSKYGTSSDPLLFWTRSDGTLMKDENDNISIKFLGYDGTISWTDSRTNYLLTKTSTVEGGRIYGTNYDDEIIVNHPRNTVYAGSDGNGVGDDTVTANTDNNFIRLGYGDDVGILHGNNSTIEGSTVDYFVSSGNDTLISDGNNNYLFDGMHWNVFVSGGDEATIRGGGGVDTIKVYSYNPSGVNVTVTGGGNNDEYILSTGMVSVSGTDAINAGYNSATHDTLNVAITDLDSLDTLYIRNKGMTYLRHDVAAEGIHINDNTGRINIFLPNQRDWNAVKDTKVTFEDMNGNFGMLTLEQAENLPIIYPPSGVNVDGYNITVTSGFGGELWMLDGYAGTNYNNQRIVEIDASQNPNTLGIAANSQPNFVKGGTGPTSLWGGVGNVSDTLQGGGGATMFWYGKNDGNDVVFNANANDVINLYDIGLNDVAEIHMAEHSFSLGFYSGGWITVFDTGTLTPALQAADGSRYAFNRVTNSWGNS